MDCLHENDLIALSEGALHDDAFAQAEAHLDGCADCRFLLAELLQPTRMRAPSWDLPVGERIGRYVVLSRLGVGGMGTVYAAYDPQLRRKIALKLLHAHSLDEDAAEEQRLLREAQAMARLQHQNLLAVHDVGVHGGHVFLSMELIEGESLRTYLRKELRSVAQICQLFLRAGDGLRAAHQAGVIHCDVKPDNILRSFDGRIAVTDFGLARLAARDARLPTELHADLAPLAHKTDARGSLPYMAPEVLDQQQITPASDQWSFCVALYEAIYGERPFSKSTAAALKHAIAHDTPRLAARRAPSGEHVPSWLRRLLARGLSAQPQSRFADMSSLLDALSRRSMKRVRRAVASIAVAMALLGVLAAARWAAARPVRSCLREIENQPSLRAPRVQEGWRHSTLWPQIQRQLAAYRDRFITTLQKSCRDTLERRSQSAETMARRTRCAEMQLEDLAALNRLLSTPPAFDDRSPFAEIVAQRLWHYVMQLPSADRCSAARVLLNKNSSSARIDNGRQLISEARLLRLLELPADADARLRQAIQLASLRSDEKLQAEAQLEGGLLQATRNDPRAASVHTIKQALWTAQGAADDELAARAWVKLLGALAARNEPNAELQRLLPIARAAVLRIGGDSQLDAELVAVSRRVDAQ